MMSDSQQARVRQQIRTAIDRYRAREIGLGDFIGALDPIVDEVQPEKTWERVSESFNELDAFYAITATAGDADPGGPVVPSEEQQRNIDRIVTDIEQFLR